MTIRTQTRKWRTFFLTHQKREVISLLCLRLHFLSRCCFPLSLEISKKPSGRTRPYFINKRTHIFLSNTENTKEQLTLLQQDLYKHDTPTLLLHSSSALEIVASQYFQHKLSYWPVVQFVRNVSYQTSDSLKWVQWWNKFYVMQSLSLCLVYYLIRNVIFQSTESRRVSGSMTPWF